MQPERERAGHRLARWQSDGWKRGRTIASIVAAAVESGRQNSSTRVALAVELVRLRRRRVARQQCSAIWASPRQLCMQQVPQTPAAVRRRKFPIVPLALVGLIGLSSYAFKWTVDRRQKQLDEQALHARVRT